MQRYRAYGASSGEEEEEFQGTQEALETQEEEPVVHLEAMDDDLCQTDGKPSPPPPSSESKSVGKPPGGAAGTAVKYSLFTWFAVLALLGVWSSVAVVYFDIVDYDGVMARARDFRANFTQVLQGKLSAYDADGDGDFDAEDAKVLLDDGKFKGPRGKQAYRRALRRLDRDTEEAELHEEEIPEEGLWSKNATPGVPVRDEVLRSVLREELGHAQELTEARRIARVALSEIQTLLAQDERGQEAARRVQVENLELARERLRLEKERLGLEKERLEVDKTKAEAERENLAWEKLQREKSQAEKERAEREKVAREKERAERERAEAEKVAAAEKAAAAAQKERAEKERLERERLALESKAAQDRERLEKLERERSAQERDEADGESREEEDDREERKRPPAANDSLAQRKEADARSEERRADMARRDAADKERLARERARLAQEKAAREKEKEKEREKERELALRLSREKAAREKAQAERAEVRREKLADKTPPVMRKK
ncbi:uncharacterized protein unm_hu7910 isoform X2 [Stigmatopora argus]